MHELETNNVKYLLFYCQGVTNEYTNGLSNVSRYVLELIMAFNFNKFTVKVQETVKNSIEIYIFSLKQYITL